MLGKFELLVKRYPAWGSPSFPHNYKPPGKVSNYIHSLEIGAMVQFKHIAFNIKKQYPFTVRRPLVYLVQRTFRLLYPLLLYHRGSLRHTESDW